MNFIEVNRGLRLVPQTVTGLATLPGEMYFNSVLGIIYYHNGLENTLQGMDWPTLYASDVSSLNVAIAEVTTNNGGIICIKAAITWSGSNLSIPKNTIILGSYYTITINSLHSIILGDDCQVRNLFVATGAGKTSGILLQSTAKRCTIEQCKFTGGAAIIGVSIAAPAVNSRMYRCMFTGGITYTVTGSDNIATDTVVF